MAKLTKQQTNELLSILNRLVSVKKYLDSDSVCGLARPTTNPNGGSFTIVNPACAKDGITSVDVVNHKLGSSLVMFYDAEKLLDKFIFENGGAK